MAEQFILARENGRSIPKEDRIFGISNRAKEAIRQKGAEAVVNGTIGSRRYGATTTGEVSGDVDIEVKLDKPGTFRLNLFSHSADQYSSFLDYSQRNGIGIAYQREFAKPPSGQRVLEIDSTGRSKPIISDELR